MYNLIDYTDNYSKTSGSSWQYFKDEPVVNSNGSIAECNEANPSKSFNSKANITGQIGKNGRKDV